MERFKANQAANEIRDEDHAGDANVEIIDAFSDESAKFFEALGEGSSDDVADGTEESDDNLEPRNVTLYKVSSGGEDVNVSVIGGKPLGQDMLNQSVLVFFFKYFRLNFIQ